MTRTLSLFVCISIIVIILCGCGVIPSATEPQSTTAQPMASTEAAGSASDSASPETTVSAAPEEEPSLMGELDGSQYINKALGFSATIPDGWKFASTELISELTGQAKDLANSVMDMETQSIITIVLCTQNEYDSSGPANPNFNIGFSNQDSVLQMLSDTATFEQFVDQLQSTYINMYAQLYPDSTVSSTGEQSLMINDKEYAVIRTKTTGNGFSMYQDQYFTQLESGALTITTTYFDETSKNILDTFMQSIVYE